MKKIIFLLFCLLFCTISAQVRISGKVYDEIDEPLAGASVYINNTTIGTSTNFEGEFILEIPKGRYNLVISYIGYESIREKIDDNTNHTSLIFRLKPKRTLLDEVVIRKNKISGLKRREYLQLFRYHFLGDSRMARTCKIENRDAIEFDFDSVTRTLEVSAKEPLRIINNGLGYNITYDLVNFELTLDKVNYVGNVRYEEQKGSMRDKLKWFKNRQAAFKGSSSHFLKSIQENKVEKEGFLVDLIDRKHNPKHPSLKEIQQAKDIYQKRREGKERDYLLSKKGELDYYEAIRVIRRTDHKPFIEKPIEKKIDLSQYTKKMNGASFLSFKNYLKITYTKEPPEKNYQNKKGMSKYQVSYLKLKKDKVQFDTNGEFKDPLEALLFGYWAYGKVSNELPLNYQLE